MLGWFNNNSGGGSGSRRSSRTSGRPSIGDGNGVATDTFSLKTLQDLYNTLVKYQDVSASNQDILVETIRSIAEVIVYGDQHTELLFDYFCEKNMFPLFLGLLDHPNCGTRLKIQIIQSVSILVQNIRSEISLYYTLSNNHVNRLISHQFNFQSEEVLDYYISFLKTLSLKLNKKTIQFFFNDRLNTFPLFSEAVKFFDHPEGMVRTAVRTITLNVFRVDDDMMRQYLVNGPVVPYIEHVVRHIHQRCRRLHLLLVRASLAGGSGKTMEENQNRLDDKTISSLLLKLEVGLSEQQDHLLYLQDILDLNVPGMDDIIVDSVMAYLFLPLIISSLLPQTCPFSELDDLNEKDFKEAGLEKSYVPELDSSSSGSLLSLFLLAHACFWFTNSKMMNRVVETIFLPAPVETNTTEDNKTLFGEDVVVYEELDNEGQSEIRKRKVNQNNRNQMKDDNGQNEDEVSGGGGDNDDDDDDDDDETDGASSLFENQGKPCLDSPSFLVSRESRGESDGNPVRRSFLNFLQHPNERHCLGAICVLYALVNNSNIDPDLLDRAGLVPSRHHKVDTRQHQREKVIQQVMEDLITSAVEKRQQHEKDHATPNQQDQGQKHEEGDDDDDDDEEEDEQQTLCYPHEIVTSLLNILLRDPPTCTLTQRVAAKLIIDLTFFEGDGPCLTKFHADMLDRAFKSSGLRFEKQMQLQEFKKHPALFVEMFESEWASLCEGPLQVESLMTLPEVLMPVDAPLSTDRTLLPLDSRQPFSILESTRCVIRSFMILRLLWVTLNRKSNSLLVNLGSANPVQNGGPTSPASTAQQQENQLIDLGKCSFIKVNVMNPRSGKSSVQPAFMVIANGSLVLAEPAEKSITGKGTIRSVSPLHRLSFFEGHNDPLLLHVTIRSSSSNPIGWAHRQRQPLVARSSLTPSADGLGFEGTNGSASANGHVFPWQSSIPNASKNNHDLREVPAWHLTLRFDDLASAYWAREQLQQAINATMNSKLRKMKKLIP